MNSVLSSLREVLSQRGIRVSEAPVWIRIIYPDGRCYGAKWYLRADDSESFDTVVATYRGIREFFLKEASPAAWIRGKGPYILKRTFTLALLVKHEGVDCPPMCELDLRRPADDMFAVVFGTAGYLDEHLSARASDSSFPLDKSAVPYRRRKSGRLSYGNVGAARG